MTEEVKTVEFKPYTRNGEHLVAGMWDSNSGGLMTASTYHGARDDIMTMRAKDSATGELFDKYLADANKGTRWTDTQMDGLKKALGKNGIELSGTITDVGLDMKASGYSFGHRPALAIDVNGRPMHPDVVARTLGNRLEGEVQRADTSVKTSEAGLKIKAENVKAITEDLAADAAKRGFRQTENMITDQIVQHARRFGVAGKAVGVATAGAMAMVSGANASEIGQESINAVAPGLGTLALGQGPSKTGVACEAFGQAAGTVAGIGAGLGVGAATSLTGPLAVVAGGAAGMATEAAATCNKIAVKLGFN